MRSWVKDLEGGGGSFWKSCVRGGGGGFWVSCVGGGVKVFGIVDKTESLNFHNSFERARYT